MAEFNQAFWRWFGDSKVVDTQGQPLVVYHGTVSYGDFTKFRAGHHGVLGPGIYFTDQQDFAKTYTQKGGGGGRIVEVYLSLRNPLIVHGGEGADVLLKAIYGRDSVFRKREHKQGNISYIVTSSDIRKVKDSGHDGIIWTHPSGNEYAAFYPSQIKSATGNDGTWDTDDPDIKSNPPAERPDWVKAYLKNLKQHILEAEDLRNERYELGVEPDDADQMHLSEVSDVLDAYNDEAAGSHGDLPRMMIDDDGKLREADDPDSTSNPEEITPVGDKDEEDLESANVGCANADDALALAGMLEEYGEEEYALAANPRYRRMKIKRKDKETGLSRYVTSKTVDARSVFPGVVESGLQGVDPHISMEDLSLDTKDMFSSSAKLAKSEKWGYWTPALYLASGTVAESGEDLCPHASDGCRKNCLFVSGQREMQAHTAFEVTKYLQAGKRLSFPTNLSLLRTYAYRYDYEGFAAKLVEAIEKERDVAVRMGLRYAIRLNATSDLPWENSGLMQQFSDVPFYDYTKIPHRAMRFAQSGAPAFFQDIEYHREASNPPRSWHKTEEWPTNYHLSFSYSEINLAWCLILLAQGVNVVVPFTPTLGKESWMFDPKKQKDILPKHFLGRPVIDGDAYDIRFIDNAYWPQVLNSPPPYIVGLRVKGHYQRRNAQENSFFFDGAAAQSFGSDEQFIAGHIVQNTQEAIRQGKRGILPPLSLAQEFMQPELFEAFRGSLPTIH